LLAVTALEERRCDSPGDAAAWVLAAKISRGVAAVHGDSMRGTYVETFALRAASDCLGQAAKDGVVLAAWDQGGTLAGMGKVRVIGSAYWSNASGLKRHL